jgi:hypothetical protein
MDREKWERERPPRDQVGRHAPEDPRTNVRRAPFAQRWQILVELAKVRSRETVPILNPNFGCSARPIRLFGAKLHGLSIHLAGCLQVFPPRPR